MLESGEKQQQDQVRGSSACSASLGHGSCALDECGRSISERVSSSGLFVSLSSTLGLSKRVWSVGTELYCKVERESGHVGIYGVICRPRDLMSASAFSLVISRYRRVTDDFGRLYGNFKSPRKVLERFFDVLERD